MVTAKSTRSTVVMWILTDVSTVCVALLIAFRLTFGGVLPGLHAVHASASNLPAFRHPGALLLSFLIWFIAGLVMISRRYHLYEPLRVTSALHEQRVTLQACITAGLLLTGGLYVIHGEIVSRVLGAVDDLISATMLCLRRLCWRAIIYRRFERGIEMRNILIIGTGRVGQALDITSTAFATSDTRFKGFHPCVRSLDLDMPSMSGDVLGGVDHIFHLAREHFVDEIFVASPCERGLVKHIVEQAREAGVDIRVVPDLYDGLAWNSSS